MKRILFLYKTPRKKIYSDWLKGIGSDTTLYGANQLEKLGCKVDFYDIAFSKLNLLRWLFYPVHLIAAKKTGLGFKIDQALLLLPILNKYDAVVSTIDSAGLPFLFLKKLRLFKKSLVYISVDFAFRMTNDWPFNWYENLLGYADAIVCYDKLEEKVLKKFNHNTYFLNVGVDEHFYSDSKVRPTIKNKKKVVLAFGRDRDRDYKTFVSAISKLKVQGEIVCSKENIRGINLPANFRVYYDLPAYLLKKRIYDADIVVIPIKNVKRPGGHLSLLDSMFSKRPLIIAGNKWISSAYGFKNNRECLYYDPEDAKDLSEKINFLLSNPDFSKSLAINAYQKATVYSTKNFARNLKSIIEKLR